MENLQIFSDFKGIVRFLTFDLLAVIVDPDLVGSRPARLEGDPVHTRFVLTDLAREPQPVMGDLCCHVTFTNPSTVS